MTVRAQPTGTTAYRLKWLRQTHRLTKRKAAENLNMTESRLNQIESGRKGKNALLFEEAVRFAQFYNVTLDYLAGREGE